MNKTFYSKVGGNFCYVRGVTAHWSCDNITADKWETSHYFPSDMERNDYVARLVKYGSVETMTRPPFSCGYVDPLTAELRNDALKQIRIEQSARPLDFIRKWCTELRYEQFINRDITREKAFQFAEKRMERKVFKELVREENRLKSIKNTRLPNKIACRVDYHKNPAVIVAAVYVDDNRPLFGRVRGYGYAAETVAIADCLNRSNAALAILVHAKENAIQTGLTDLSVTSSTGRSNEKCVGYGAGYGVVPSFEGGTGRGALVELFTKNGYDVRTIVTDTQLVCIFEKKEG